MNLAKITPNQEATLQAIAERKDPTGAWAKGILDALTEWRNSLTVKPPENPPEGTQPPPDPSNEPQRAIPKGALGNCEDCSEPINTRKERQPFHNRKEDTVIFVCLACANKRWREFNKIPLCRHGKRMSDYCEECQSAIRFHPPEDPRRG